MYITGFGEDSHQFQKDKMGCTIAGIFLENEPAFDADSDGDVVFHAICQAITSVTHIPILGKIAIDLCHKQNISDSAVYLEHALKTLNNFQILHCVISLTCLKPRLQKYAEMIRSNVAKCLKIEIVQVGVIFTTGNNLSFSSKGEGVDCRVVLSLKKLVHIQD